MHVARLIAKLAVKVALDVGSPGGLESAVAGTIGRVAALPGALAIGQERAGDMLWEADPNSSAIQKALSQMQQKSPEALNYTKVRFGGTNAWDDLQRVWNNPRLSPIGRALGLATTLPNSAVASVMRNTHYNPMSDTAVIYGRVPSILQHELGHAVDFNSGKNSWLRDLYMLAGLPERQIGLQAGPVTHWQEVAANRNVNNALGDDPSARAEAWRRLTPAYGTYAVGTGMGGLAVHDRIAKNLANNRPWWSRGLTPKELAGNLAAGVSEIHPKTPLKSLQNMAAKISPKNPGLALMLGSLATAGFGGRAIGELRNYLAGEQ